MFFVMPARVGCGLLAVVTLLLVVVIGMATR